MKETKLLNRNWELKKIEPVKRIDADSLAADTEGWLTVAEMPAQVQDVLLAHGLLPEELLDGWCKNALWIAEYDWVYRCRFWGRQAEHAQLYLEGLDTYADVYLNGRLILEHNDFYLPGEADITGLPEGENSILIHFHRVSDYLDRLPLEEQWKGAVPPCKMIRKPVHDFPPEKEVWGSNYQGAVPWFTPVGVYRNIYLHIYDRTRITECNLSVSVDEDCRGFVRLKLAGTGKPEQTQIQVQLFDREGRELINGSYMGEEAGGLSWRCCRDITVEKPSLWYPRGFGEPYLYRLAVSVYEEGRPADSREKRIGFKRVEMPSPLEFFINGKKVRLWGGSLDPLQGYTHCFLPERAERLYTMIENANFNTLRIWGEGIPFPDEFYDMADERGILIWQEFFMGHGAVPDSPKYREKYKEEAAFLIKRLRHRASLLMWCGGNETVMGAEFYGFHPYGKEVLLEDFPGLLKELDPDRYYHPNSPWGGEWANDPRSGDYHTYDCVWEYPYREYPNFISEHIRTSPPVLHSLKRMIRGEVWEDGYQGKQEYDTPFIMPENWIERSNISAQGQRKTGAFWEYYDADTAADMIYRFAASYGQEIRRYGEQIRRGSRRPAESGKRSKGYLTCKLLDTWPKIYCSTIDFYQEGFLPYYTVGRMFDPILLSFAKEESIRLWLVNDSGEAVEGTVLVGIYHPGQERFLKQDERCVSVAQGEADEVFDLAAYRYFPKDCILYAELRDRDGSCIKSCVDYVDIERHLKFPEANINVAVEGSEIIIETDRFVRCVEITGRNGDNEFGWLFSDNYFDLMPGCLKRVRVVAGGEGQISVKGHYSDACKTVTFKAW